MKHGTVNSEVTLELPGGVQVVSVITKKSAQNLRLSKAEVHRLSQSHNNYPAKESNLGRIDGSKEFFRLLINCLKV